jgi:acyl-coenzyme A thioesterase PaaI-like protein
MSTIPSPPVDDGNCFVCGPHNTDGLQVRFERDGESGARARVILDPKYQGWRDVAHGGVVMMLLDEVMAHASGVAGQRGMTASVAVRFRGPVPLGVELMLRGIVKWRRGKVLGVEGTLCGPDGATLASAEGSFVSAGTAEPGEFMGQR